MLKKCWITKNNDNYSITLESIDPKIPISCSDMLFPKEPTEKHPLRHTINIGVLSFEDLVLLKNELQFMIEEGRNYVDY